MLPRLIAVLVLLFAVIGIASAFKRAQRQRELNRQREKKTFRPQAAPQSEAGGEAPNSAKKAKSADSTDVVMMSKKEGAQRRDALTGQAIDPNGRVWQCDNCQSLYQEASAQALDRDSEGKCLQCGHKARSLVAFSEP